ncbi:uncharacterized protein CCOS01_16719 [Colletotrichum costaricense]|uniref:Uncharacterized protein n=1 Tax=Colletotrichum costaricense TaxID=1209916 RepID=A0AAJ0DS87_9PEZI|nr:uncharacterized protein CCOS01_16719 [Colletotrichum costaricense]KAK1505145.1 hypothetical protein CCOS01_16719 [Colletotrichum costaricense]
MRLAAVDDSKQGNAGAATGGGISCPQQSLFSRVDSIDSPSVPSDAWPCEGLGAQNDSSICHPLGKGQGQSTTLREFIRHAAFQRSSGQGGT